MNSAFIVSAFIIASCACRQAAKALDCKSFTREFESHHALHNTNDEFRTLNDELFSFQRS